MDQPGKLLVPKDYMRRVNSWVSTWLFSYFCALTVVIQGNIVVATELARRYGDQGIVSIAVNPGNLQPQCYGIDLVTYFVGRKYQDRYTEKHGLVQKSAHCMFTQNFKRLEGSHYGQMLCRILS